MKDKNGREITVGCYVRLLNVQPNWFEFEPDEGAKMLYEACENPVLVSDIYDGKVTVDLPATKDHNGEVVGNGITISPDKLEVV